MGRRAPDLPIAKLNNAERTVSDAKLVCLGGLITAPFFHAARCLLLSCCCSC
jgi:hypothetical protein